MSLENRLSGEETNSSLPASPDTGWHEVPPALPPLGILSGLSEASLATLGAYGYYQAFPAGTILIHEGQPQNRFYVVVSGKLEITSGPPGRQVRLNVAEPGECLGEVSLLESTTASANAKVLDDAVLWSMDLAALRLYLEEHSGGGGALLIGMAECLSGRLRQANQLIARHHFRPVEILPRSFGGAITAENTPVELGFFDRLKLSLLGEKKVHIPTDIRL
jgi:CRP-like cAMP-binding protein